MSILFTVFGYVPIIIEIGLLNINFPPNTFYFTQIFENLIFTNSPTQSEVNILLSQKIYGFNVTEFAPDQLPHK